MLVLTPGLAVLLVGSLVVGLLRFSVPTRGLDTFSWPGSYEALAHLWLGVLVGVGLWKTPENLAVYQPLEDAITERFTRLAAWACLGVLTLLEVVMFFRG
jgi:hypothetical protein